MRNHNTKIKALIGLSLLIVGLCGCSPSRWEHADISQISADGRTITTWTDVEIEGTGPGAFSGGNAWVRFKPRGAKEITLVAPHIITYK